MFQKENQSNNSTNKYLGETSSHNKDISNINSAGIKIQKFLRNAIAIKYWRLAQDYESTMELATAYNKTKIFDKTIQENTEPPKTINLQRTPLLKIANKILDNYKEIPYPNKVEIFEIANLSAIDNEDIREKIYNSLIDEIHILDNDIKILNLDKMEAITTMFSLLSPSFLSKNHPDVILAVLLKVSKWLEKQILKLKDSKNQAKQLSPVLNIYAKMIDGLLSNKHLQQMDTANHQQTISPTKILAQINQQDYPVSQSSTSPNSTTNDMPYNTKKSLLGSGLNKGVRDRLTLGVKKIINHNDISIRYLSSYITQSIARIAEKGDSNLGQIVNRSKHLLLGVSGLGLMIASGGCSISDFQELFKNTMLTIKDSRMSRKKWYDHARKITNSITEAEDDPEKLNFALGEITSYYKSTNNISWELCYAILRSLANQINDYKNIDIKIRLLDLASQIALDYHCRDIYVTESAIEILIEACSSPLEKLQENAKNRIQHLASEMTFSKKTKYLQEMMKNAQEADLKNADSSYGTTKPNSLLLQTRKELYPLEEKIRTIKKSCYTSLMNTSLNRPIPFLCNEDNLGQRTKDFIEKTSLVSSPRLFIHGDIGIGKSLFCRNLENKYWSKYEQKGTIPLLISLSELAQSKYDTIDKLLEDHEFHQSEINSLKEEDCIHNNTNNASGNNSPRLLLIIDDYVSDKINLDDLTYGWNNVKVIALTNTNNVDTREHDNHLFMKPFTETQITEFISQSLTKWKKITKNKYTNDFSAEDIKQLIKENDLMELATNPFILSTLIEIVLANLEVNRTTSLSSLSSSQAETHYILNKMTKYKIYSMLVGSCFARQLNQTTEINSYAISIARFMFEQNIETLTASQNEALAMEAEVLSNKGILFKKTSSERSYAFIHKSVQQFLIAKEILKEISTTEIKPSSLINKAYIQNHPDILRFILDEISPENVAALEQIILSTQEDTKLKRKSNIAISSANAATIYVRTRHTQIIGSKNWSNTQIMGADISGAHFYDMTFTGSHWSNVTAKAIFLNSCACNNMGLTGIDIGEGEEIIGQTLKANTQDNTSIPSNSKPSHIINGHENLVTSIYISEPYIFSGSRDKTVRIWDKKTKECRKILEGHTGWVNSIYSNSTYLFSGSNDKTVRVWSIETGSIIKILEGHKRWVKSICATEHYAFSGSYDHNIRIWDIYTGKCISVIKAHSSNIVSLSICYSVNNEDKLISSDADGVTIEWGIGNIESKVHLLHAGGRKHWNQPFKFLDNTAENVHGLSKNNQNLLAKHRFAPKYNESMPLNPSEEDTSMQQQGDNLTLLSNAKPIHSSTLKNNTKPPKRGKIVESLDSCQKFIDTSCNTSNFCG